MSHRKKINSLKKSIFKYLPSKAQEKLILKKFSENLKLDKNVVIKFASNEEELQDSLSVLYAAYRDSHLTNFNKHKLKVTKYHALPTTHVIIAYHKGIPVGTMSIIPDGHFKLPLEEHWDVGEIRKNARKICEIGSLAILPEFQKKSGSILLPMITFFLRSSEYYLKYNHIVCAVHPNAQPFYQHILQAKKISNKVINYDMANGAKAIAMHIDSNALRDRLKNTDPDDEYGIFHYFYEKSFGDSFKFCWEDYSDGISHVPTPETFQKLFTDVMNINTDLNSDEKKKLKSFFNAHSYTHLIQAVDDKHLLAREAFRYLCSMKATLLDKDLRQLKVEVVSCSAVGAGLRYVNENVDLKIGDQITVNIKVTTVKTLPMTAIVRFLKDGLIGITFDRPISGEWTKLISHIENKYHVSSDEDKQLRKGA